MTTTVPSKTVGTVLFAHTQHLTGVITPGAAVDVSGKFAVRASIKMGRTIATALTNNVKFRLEGSFSAVNDEWEPLKQWTSENGLTAASTSTVNDAVFNAGDDNFVITSATGIAAGDRLYLRETVTPANSEWSRVESVSGTTITLEEGVTRAHTNGITVTDLAESWTFVLNVESLKRVRLVVDSASLAAGQTVDILAWLNSLDSLTTT